MIEKSVFAVVLAAFWGTAYAVWLQRTKSGAFIAARLTWLSVVIGCGLNLLIALIVLDGHVWLVLMAIFAASGSPIVIRSLINERRLQMDVINAQTTRKTV